MNAPSRLLLLGHSYLAKENRKQLNALASHCEVHVLSPSSWHEGMTHYDLKPGVVEGNNWRLHFLAERRIPGLPQSQYLLPDLRKSLSALRPQLIHIESDPWTLFAWQMIRARNRFDRAVPVVCTAKQNTYTRRGGLKDFLKRKMAYWGIGNTARFIGVSPAVPEIYRQQFGLAPRNFDLNTHLGVDTEHFCPADRSRVIALRQRWLKEDAVNAVVVGYCGRLEDYKGITDLVVAIERTRELTGLDMRLMTLGSGPLQNELQLKAKTCPWFTLHARVPHAEVAEFLQTLDLFVMPAWKSAAHEEHDGHAIIEALSCGLPCIGTDSGALRELLDDVGWIVPAGDREALVRSLQNFAKHSRKGQAGTVNCAGRNKMVEHYSLSAVSDRNWATYRRARDEWKSKISK